MPIVISPNKLYAKKPDGSGYLSANVISDQTTAEQVAAIWEQAEAAREYVPSDVTTLNGRVDDLKSALNDIADATTNVEVTSLTLAAFSPTEWSGYIIKSDGTTTTLNTYHTYYFKPTENIKFYVDTNTGIPIRFCVFKNGSANAGTHSFSGMFAGYSEDAATRPTAANPIDVSTNDMVVMSFPANYYASSISVGTVAILLKVVNNLNSLSTADALSAKQGKILNDKIEDALSLFITPVNKTGKLSIFNPTEWNGYIMTASGTVTSLNTYRTYFFKPTENIKFYFGTNDFYLRFGVFRNGTANSTNHSFTGTFESYSEEAATRPTVSNPIDVTPNDVIVVCCEAYHEDYDILIGYFVDMKEGNVIKIKKTASNTFSLYIPSQKLTDYAEYQFVKYTKTWDSLSYTDGDGNTQTATNVKSSDCWNNLHVMNENGVEIVSGNTNFICKVIGESGHAGDGHGNEVALYTAFIADGKEIDIDTMSVGDEFECSVFKFILRSDVYSVGGGGNEYSNAYPALDTSGNPIKNFQHNMEVTYEVGNIVTIDNKLIVKRNGIRFEQCHGAMLECFFGGFDNVYCNNAEGTRNVVDGSGDVTVPSDSTINLKTNTSQKCDTVEMYGDTYYLRQEMKQNRSSRDDKTNVQFQFYNNRLKAYFQPVVAYYGDESETEPIETFNAGDYIAVTDKRIIEI